MNDLLNIEFETINGEKAIRRPLLLDEFEEDFQALFNSRPNRKGYRAILLNRAS